MAFNSATYQGTPNNSTFGAARFKPYRGNDVKQGRGGYVKLASGVWATLHENPYCDCGFSVELLGWGDTFGGALSDYSAADQELLKQTL